MYNNNNYYYKIERHLASPPSCPALFHRLLNAQFCWVALLNHIDPPYMVDIGLVNRLSVSNTTQSIFFFTCIQEKMSEGLTCMNPLWIPGDSRFLFPCECVCTLWWTGVPSHPSLMARASRELDDGWIDIIYANQFSCLPFHKKQTCGMGADYPMTMYFQCPGSESCPQTWVFGVYMPRPPIPMDCLQTLQSPPISCPRNVQLADMHLLKAHV